MTGGVRRTTLRVRVVSAMLLAASTLVWMPGSQVGAWSSDDRAVAVFGGTSDDKVESVTVDSSGRAETNRRTGRVLPVKRPGGPAGGVAGG